MKFPMKSSFTTPVAEAYSTPNYLLLHRLISFRVDVGLAAGHKSVHLDQQGG